MNDIKTTSGFIQPNFHKEDSTSKEVDHADISQFDAIYNNNDKPNKEIEGFMNGDDWESKKGYNPEYDQFKNCISYKENGDSYDVQVDKPKNCTDNKLYADFVSWFGSNLDQMADKLQAQIIASAINSLLNNIKNIQKSSFAPESPNALLAGGQDVNSQQVDALKDFIKTLVSIKPGDAQLIETTAIKAVIKHSPNNIGQFASAIAQSAFQPLQNAHQQQDIPAVLGAVMKSAGECPP